LQYIKQCFAKKIRELKTLVSIEGRDNSINTPYKLSVLIKPNTVLKHILQADLNLLNVETKYFNKARSYMHKQKYRYLNNTNLTL